MAVDDKKIALGLVEPTATEQAGILSAIVLTAAANGRTTDYEISHVYQIVTGHPLHEDMAQFAFRRYQTLDPDSLDSIRLEPGSTPLARRRILSAALITGCVIGGASPNIARVIEHISDCIGATRDDIAAANTALQSWKSNDSGLTGTPLITLLRTKPLKLGSA